MRKTLLLIPLLFVALSSNAQIAKVELAEHDSQSNIEDIIIVFKMHFDIGYTDWAEGILQKYRGPMLESTLKDIDDSYSLPKEEQFVWTVPAWPLKYIIENCADSLKPSLDRALRAGRITPHALPTTFETEASDYETLVRGLEYSYDIRKNAGREAARDAKLTDVPSHSHIIPTLLKHSGVDILHIGCNAGSKAPELPVLSFWEGPDASRILLFYWAEYYGSSVTPPKNWPHKTWMAMTHTHENSGAPTLEEVEAILREAKEKMPNAKVRIGEMKDFYDALMAENPDLPVIKGDMPDTWIHGYMSNPKQTSKARSLHRSIYSTESLNALLGLWGSPYRNHDREFAAAIEQQVLYDEHSFGIATTHGNQQDWYFDEQFEVSKSLGEYDYSEASWREKQNRAEEAERIVKPIERNQMRALAANVAQEGKRVVVYNPTPWNRNDRVNMYLGIYQKQFDIYALKDLTTGEVIPAWNRRNLLSFDAKNIPPMGYKTYAVITEPQSLESGVKVDTIANILENRWFKIVVNSKDGSLKSVIDKSSGRELVDKNSEYGFSAMVHEIYGNEDIDRYNEAYIRKTAQWAYPEMCRPYTTNDKKITAFGSCKKLRYELMNNGVRLSAMCEVDKTEQPYIINYTLYADQPYVEVTCGVNQKNVDSRPEAMWLSFPFDIKEPEHKVLRLGGVVDPTKDFVDFSNHYYYFTNGSIALKSKDGWAVALDNPDAPGISIDSIGLLRFGKKFAPKTGLVFANLMNTQWGTNFTEWVEGSFHATFRIRSHESYDAAKTLVRPADEARMPLLAAFTEGDSGTLPTSQAGVGIDRDGVSVTAFKKEGDNLLLRLWEQAGESGMVTVTLPENCSYNRAYFCNLHGEKSGATLPILNNTIEVNIPHNGPVTLILEK